MPRTFFDLNLFANMVAKLDNIVGELVRFDMSANNVGQFGHTLNGAFPFSITVHAQNIRTQKFVLRES